MVGDIYSIKASMNNNFRQAVEKIVSCKGLPCDVSSQRISCTQCMRDDILKAYRAEVDKMAEMMPTITDDYYLITPASKMLKAYKRKCQAFLMEQVR